MLNKIVIMGRVVRDPELRYTQSQTPVASFSLACERDRKNQNGEKETDFIDCSAWRHTADFISKYMTKGTLIVVVGRLQIRTYTDKKGNKRTAPEIVVDNAYFAESKRKEDRNRIPDASEYTGWDMKPPHPTDADAPPEFENTPPHDIDELMQNFPGMVEYADADGEDGFPF